MSSTSLFGIVNGNLSPKTAQLAKEAAKYSRQDGVGSYFFSANTKHFETIVAATWGCFTNLIYGPFEEVGNAFVEDKSITLPITIYQNICKRGADAVFHLIIAAESVAAIAFSFFGEAHRVHDWACTDSFVNNDPATLREELKLLEATIDKLKEEDAAKLLEKLVELYEKAFPGYWYCRTISKHLKKQITDDNRAEIESIYKHFDEAIMPRLLEEKCDVPIDPAHFAKCLQYLDGVDNEECLREFVNGLGNNSEKTIAECTSRNYYAFYDAQNDPQVPKVGLDSDKKQIQKLTKQLEDARRRAQLAASQAPAVTDSSLLASENVEELKIEIRKLTKLLTPGLVEISQLITLLEAKHGEEGVPGIIAHFKEIQESLKDPSKRVAVHKTDFTKALDFISENKKDLKKFVNNFSKFGDHYLQSLREKSFANAKARLLAGKKRSDENKKQLEEKKYQIAQLQVDLLSRHLDPLGGRLAGVLSLYFENGDKTAKSLASAVVGYLHDKDDLVKAFTESPVLSYKAYGLASHPSGEIIRSLMDNPRQKVSVKEKTVKKAFEQMRDSAQIPHNSDDFKFLLGFISDPVKVANEIREETVDEVAALRNCLRCANDPVWNQINAVLDLGEGIVGRKTHPLAPILRKFFDGQEDVTQYYMNNQETEIPFFTVGMESVDSTGDVSVSLGKRLKKTGVDRFNIPESQVKTLKDAFKCFKRHLEKKSEENPEKYTGAIAFLADFIDDPQATANRVIEKYSVQALQGRVDDLSNALRQIRKDRDDAARELDTEKQKSVESLKRTQAALEAQNKTIARLRAQLDENSNKASDEKAQAANAEEVAQLVAQLEEARAALAAKEQELTDAQTEAAKLTRELEDARANLTRAEEELSQKNEEASTDREEQEWISEQVAELKIQLGEAQTALAAKEQELSDAQRRFEAKEKALVGAHATAQAETAKRIERLGAELQVTTEEATAKTAQLKTSQDEAADLRAQLAAFQEEPANKQELKEERPRSGGVKALADSIVETAKSSSPHRGVSSSQIQKDNSKEFEILKRDVAITLKLLEIGTYKDVVVETLWNQLDHVLEKFSSQSWEGLEWCSKRNKYIEIWEGYFGEIVTQDKKLIERGKYQEFMLYAHKSKANNNILYPKTLKKIREDLVSQKEPTDFTATNRRLTQTKRKEANIWENSFVGKLTICLTDSEFRAELQKKKSEVKTRKSFKENIELLLGTWQV